MEAEMAEMVRSAIFESRPEELEFPPRSLDHADHVVRTALAGHTKLASDHLLHREMVGKLERTVGDVIRQLNLEFRKSDRAVEEDILVRSRSYETLIQLAFSLFGVEKKWIGFSEEEVEGTLSKIIQALDEWEGMERGEIGDCPIAKATIEKVLSELKMVMSHYYRAPGSMSAKMAEEIEAKLDDDRLLSSFMEAAREEIQGNVYYRMSMEGTCKFGNDYALGLRWVRHLGYVQVSTNPVLAAVAYEDDPSLWEGFKGESFCRDLRAVVEEHPEWHEHPEDYGDEITMKATELSIFPNLAVFRPIAIASDFYHGMISYQLNPNVASSREGSLRDALQIYSDATDFLRKYDEYLLWGYSTHVEKGRPNLVFKVTGNTPAAIQITSDLESLGIGTNNTVTYTVPQETTLILSKIEGRAKAIKMGITPTMCYETTMGGRLDDHLREKQAEALLGRALARIGDDALEELAKELGAWEKIKGMDSLEEKIRTVCHHSHLRPITKEPFVELLAKAGVGGNSKEEVRRFLSQLEEDIGYAGITVTHRVYHIFFSPENRPKWLAYIRSKYGLSEEEAEMVLGRIDVLPASKRKPMDTLLTLASINMTNTEFPNHQTNVLMESRKPDFRMEDYRESVSKDIDPAIIHRLVEEHEDIREDARDALELTPELIERLREVGVEVDFGDRGHEPEEWPEFGSVVKTMDQFTKAYNRFREKVIEFTRQIA